MDKIRSEGRELPQSKLYQAKQARNRQDLQQQESQTETQKKIAAMKKKAEMVDKKFDVRNIFVISDGQDILE